MLKIKSLSCYWCIEQQVAIMTNIILTKKFAFIAECIGWGRIQAEIVDNDKFQVWSASCNRDE